MLKIPYGWTDKNILVYIVLKLTGHGRTFIAIHVQISLKHKGLQVFICRETEREFSVRHLCPKAIAFQTVAVRRTVQEY